jgi:hypothetical protein
MGVSVSCIKCEEEFVIPEQHSAQMMGQYVCRTCRKDMHEQEKGQEAE